MNDSSVVLGFLTAPYQKPEIGSKTNASDGEWASDRSRSVRVIGKHRDAFSGWNFAPPMITRGGILIFNFTESRTGPYVVSGHLSASH
jgi:hypothetical protein